VEARHGAAGSGGRPDGWQTLTECRRNAVDWTLGGGVGTPEIRS